MNNTITFPGISDPEDSRIYSLGSGGGNCFEPARMHRNAYLNIFEYVCVCVYEYVAGVYCFGMMAYIIVSNVRWCCL